MSFIGFIKNRYALGAWQIHRLLWSANKDGGQKKGSTKNLNAKKRRKLVEKMFYLPRPKSFQSTTSVFNKPKIDSQSTKTKIKYLKTIALKKKGSARPGGSPHQMDGFSQGKAHDNDFKRRWMGIGLG